MIHFAIVLISFLAVSSASTPQELWKAATEAYEAGDYSKFLATTTTLAELRPQHPYVIEAHARALALSGRCTDAAHELRRLAVMRSAVDFTQHDYDAIRGCSDFVSAARAVDDASSLRVTKAPIAFRLPAGLLPEAITWDKRTKSFFVSANRARKIVRVDAAGHVSDFVAPFDGFWGASGMGVDPGKRLLWASSRATERGAGYDATHEHEAALFAFDLDSGRLVHRFTPPADAALLDDLTVTPDGTVFVSDALGGVLRLAPGAGELEIFVPRGAIRSAQGETTHGRMLYVADYGGSIAAIDTVTRDVVHLKFPEEFPVYGIDGIAWHGGWLFAVQNGVEPNRVVAIRLTADGLHVAEWTTIAMNDPEMDEPTIGVVAAGAYTFIAASQGNKFDAQPPKLDQLRPSAIMRFDLKKLAQKP